MEIKIPAEKAIEILNKRKSEIYNLSFEPSVWRGKTENDIEEIFGILDGRKFQISRITFDTPFSEQKFAVLSKGKNQAEKFLESYIEQIEEYTSIQNERTKVKENHFENKNLELQNHLKSLTTNSSSLENENRQLKNEIRTKISKIEHLENSTVQLTDISLRKIATLISHLPSGQVLGFITTILAIFGFFFWLGTTVQDTSNNTEKFNLNKQITNQEDSIKNLNTKMKIIKSEKVELKIEFDSIKKLIKK